MYLKNKIKRKLKIDFILKFKLGLKKSIAFIFKSDGLTANSVTRIMQ